MEVVTPFKTGREEELHALQLAPRRSWIYGAVVVELVVLIVDEVEVVVVLSQIALVPRSP